MTTPATGRGRLPPLLTSAMKMPKKSDMPTLRLADHMRACQVGEQVLLLDLSASRYMGLAGRQAAAMSTIIEFGREASQSSPTAETLRIVDPLYAQGILTRDPSPYSVPLQRFLTPSEALDVRDSVPFQPLGARSIQAFLAATLVTSILLRFRSLKQISESVQARRTSLGDSDAHSRSARLHDEVAIFDTLRPLAFTSRNKCLFDSLALVMFLARRGIDAHCVLGVAARPFRAHAWTQRGDIVLNDLPEHVRGFSPIHVL